MKVDADSETHNRKEQSAPAIQKLVDLGACIVGKTKLCAFAQWEEATEAIEYTSPWSPRADGFQSSGGSSNGSGAAVAAYEWLDIAVGSDTTGSILRPALWNGCFSLRPSFGALSMEGFVPCIKYLDTLGIMGRDLRKCRYFAEAWFGDSLDAAGYRASQVSSILWPTDYWASIDPEQCEIARKFVASLENGLDLRATEISFREKWQQAPPQDAGNLSLYDYMLKATQDMWYDDYHEFDQFRHDYWAKYQRAPYLTPPTRASWEACSKISKSDRDEAARKMHVFRSWFQTTLFSSVNPIIVLPIENAQPRYRDEPPT